MKVWKYWCGGYDIDFVLLFKIFEDGVKDVNEFVFVCNVLFFLYCEYYMVLFFGSVMVGYILNGCIVGLLKINWLVDCFVWWL